MGLILTNKLESTSKRRCTTRSICVATISREALYSLHNFAAREGCLIKRHFHSYPAEGLSG
jgi:hypothetical protein